MNRTDYYSVICTRCQMAKRIAVVSEKPLDIDPIMRQNLAYDLGCPRAKEHKLCGTIEINLEPESENV